jgi:hypothetical protein
VKWPFSDAVWQVRELETELAQMSSAEEMGAFEAQMAASSKQALDRAETRVQAAEAAAAKAALDVAAANAKLRTRCASPSLASRGLV